MSRTFSPPADALAGPRLGAPDEMARLMAEAVTEAGALALSMFRTDIAAWTKDNDSPVTAADIAVDRLLRERFSTLAPGCGWLSEESVDDRARLGHRHVFVVDPIDGTRAFMAGGTDWAVSAALVEDGRPVAAVLFAPASKELFLAARGAGATLNGAMLRAGGRESLEGAAVAGPAPSLDPFARVAAIRPVPRVRSLALRLARVATAEFDLAVASGNSHDWDLAAADLVVHEAGGLLTTYAGEPLSYNAPEPRHAPLICTGRALHGAVLAVTAPGHSSRPRPPAQPDPS